MQFFLSVFGKKVATRPHQYSIFLWSRWAIFQSLHCMATFQIMSTWNMWKSGGTTVVLKNPAYKVPILKLSISFLFFRKYFNQSLSNVATLERLGNFPRYSDVRYVLHDIQVIRLSTRKLCLIEEFYLFFFFCLECAPNMCIVSEVFCVRLLSLELYWFEVVFHKRYPVISVPFTTNSSTRISCMTSWW